MNRIETLTSFEDSLVSLKWSCHRAEELNVRTRLGSDSLEASPPPKRLDKKDPILSLSLSGEQRRRRFFSLVNDMLYFVSSFAHPVA